MGNKLVGFNSIGKVVSATFGTNKKTGAKIAQVAGTAGRTVMQGVTKHGARITTIIDVPANMSKAQRNAVAMDLLKAGFTQMQAAFATGMSQSNLSRISRK